MKYVSCVKDDVEVKAFFDEEDDNREHLNRLYDMGYKVERTKSKDMILHIKDVPNIDLFNDVGLFEEPIKKFMITIYTNDLQSHKLNMKITEHEFNMKVTEMTYKGFLKNDDNESIFYPPHTINKIKTIVK